MNKIIGGIIGFAVLVGLVIGIWQVKRWWNYSWGYESKVQTTICEMVKKEALQPGKCE